MSRYSSRELQRIAEKGQIAQFQSLFQSDKDLDIKFIENDPPDVSLFFEGKKVALELTELVWDIDTDGVNKKAQELNANMILDIARMEYEKLLLPPIYVSVSFNDNYGLIKEGENLQLYSQDKKRLSAYIVVKVLEYFPENNNTWIEVPEYDENFERIIDEKINNIRIAKLDVLTENCWVTSGAASLPILTSEKIFEPIKEKEKKLYKYRNKFDQVWLLIVEGWGELAGYFDFRNLDDIKRLEIQSEFDRVFVLRSKMPELIELNLGK